MIASHRAACSSAIGTRLILTNVAERRGAVDVAFSALVGERRGRALRDRLSFPLSDDAEHVYDHAGRRRSRSVEGFPA